MKKTVLPILLCMISFISPLHADEGMWPLSELDKLDLTKAGFALGAREIFNPDGSVSLVDAIINLSGCSASFISANGLILTNHHCAFGAVQDASSAENDYLRNGLVTRNLKEEIPAKGMTVKITESYRDVSAAVLQVVKKGMSPLDRTKAIEKRIKEMEIGAEKKNPGKRAEIAEMFQGKVYVLFLSTYLKDVRLVYVPPRSIGEFGGESDNWVWPRHTGDFTILRAYAGPNGESAAYSAENVPYKPRKYLQVAPEGISEGDLMFILGYPGRTYRHQPASYLRFQEEIHMPAVVKLSQWLIATMEKAGGEERDVQLKLAARIKGLANRMKNYQGKLKGLHNLGLTAKKQAQEEALSSQIQDPETKEKYRKLQLEMASVYHEMTADYPFQHFIGSLNSNWSLLSSASALVEYAHERIKKDQEREAPYMTRNLERTRERLVRSIKNLYTPVDQQIADYLFLSLAESLTAQQLPPVLHSLCTAAAPDRKKIIASYYHERFMDAETFGKWFDQVQLDELRKCDIPIVQLALAVYPLTKQIRDREDNWKGRLDSAMAAWIDLKQILEKGRFLPDANSTLRLTWGRVKGYCPRDAVYMKPFTVLEGMLEKSMQGGDYQLEENVSALIRQGKNSSFRQGKIGGVPVNFLYDADTTGGNSGSPVLNARGQLVGINFDRAFEATINDYAWDEGYSRSIGLDIRFILWYIESTGGGHLLQEMNAGN